jgi:hypothetical protein
MIDVMQTAKHRLPDDLLVARFADWRIHRAWSALVDRAVRAPVIEILRILGQHSAVSQVSPSPNEPGRDLSRRQASVALIPNGWWHATMQALSYHSCRFICASHLVSKLSRTCSLSEGSPSPMRPSVAGSCISVRSTGRWHPNEVFVSIGGKCLCGAHR